MGRSKIKPFLKVVNYNHLMPTRYSVDIGFDKDKLNKEVLKDAMKKKKARHLVRTKFELGTDEMACLLFLHGVLKDFLVQLVLVESDVNAVASGHQVVIVDNLEERLDLAPLLNLLLGHALGHQTWVPVDAGDECVSEGLVGSTIVVGFDNDGLAASKASG